MELAFLAVFCTHTSILEVDELTIASKHLSIEGNTTLLFRFFEIIEINIVKNGGVESKYYICIQINTICKWPLY